MDIHWLRRQVANPRSTHAHDAEPLLWPGRHRLTRRALLQAGVAGGSAAALPAQAHRRDPLKFDPRAGSFHVLAGDTLLWSIDVSRFDGSPTLLHAVSAQSFRLDLSDARLPGCDLRCDLSLRARKERGSWTAELSLPAMGASARVDLYEWLSGRAAAMSFAALSASGGTRDLSVEFSGRAAMAFRPDWSFVFTGRQLASCTIDGRSARCDRVTLALADPADGIFGAEAVRRSVATFQGPEIDTLQPSVAGMRAEAVRGTELLADLSRDASNRLHAAAVWRPVGGEAILVAQQGAGSISLSDFHVAQVTGPECCKAMAARPLHGTQWVDAATVSYEIAVAADGAITAREDAAGAHAASEGVFAHRFVVPFIGADVAYFQASRSRGKAAQSVEWHRVFNFHSVDLDGYELVVRRSIDGFAGVFRFDGLELRPQLARWTIEAKPDARPQLEFEIGSQHLQEEAAYSASPPGISNGSEEVLCGLFKSEDARLQAFIASNAIDAVGGNELYQIAIVKVLVVYAEKLRKQFAQVQLPDVASSPDLQFLDFVLRLAKPWKKSDFPMGFAKYLSLEYVHLLKEAMDPPANEPRTLTPHERKAIVDGAGRFEGKLEDFVPRAVESGASRLLFDLRFESGAQIPCTIDGLLGWTGLPPRGVTFHERLSARAVPPDAVKSLAAAESLGRENGTPLVGIGGADGERASGLELPYRLQISLLGSGRPDRPTASRWQARPLEARSWNQPVALWHVRAGSPGAPPLPMRALSSPDFLKDRFFDPPPPFNSKSENGEFRASLDGHDRHNLVALSGTFGRQALLGSESVIPIDTPAGARPDQDSGLFVSQPFHASRLLLTPWGATFDTLGRWDPPGTRNGALTVSKWEHHVRIRRDVAATVEYKGFLLPLGIPAVLVKRTTREIKRAGRSDRETYRAVLIQRFYIRIEQREATYPAYGQPFDARDWFARKLQVLPAETPPLLPPEDTQVDNYGRQAFWPAIPSSATATSCSDRKLFEFTTRCGDVEFQAPLVFIDNQIAHTPSKLRDVLRHYAGHVAARNADLKSLPEPLPLKEALARVTKGEIEYLPGAGSRNSRHSTRGFVLGVSFPLDAPIPDDADPAAANDTNLQFDAERERRKQPPFYPRLSQARIASKLLAQLSGNRVELHRVAYHPTFITQAFEAPFNKGQVFLKFVDEGALLNFGDDTTRNGGPMAATTQIVAIAREHGPVGGGVDPKQRRNLRVQTKALATSTQPEDPVAKFMKGEFDPVEYFAQTMGDAKIAGCVRMVDVVKAALAVSGTKVPKINQKEVFDGLIDAIRPLLTEPTSGLLALLAKIDTALESSGVSAAALDKLRPPLAAARQALTAARAALLADSVQPDVVMGHVGEAWSQMQLFRDEVRNLTENPTALLPPALANALKDAKALYDKLDRLRRALEDLPALLREQLLAALRSELDQLEAALRASAGYRSVQDWILSARDDLAALEEAAIRGAWDRVQVVIGAAAARLGDVQRWLRVVSTASQEAQARIVMPAANMLRDAAASAEGMEGDLQQLGLDLHAISKELAKAHAGAPAQAQPPIERALEACTQLREALVTFADVLHRCGQAARGGALEVAEVSRLYFESLDTLIGKSAELYKLLLATDDILKRATASDPKKLALNATSVDPAGYIRSLKPAIERFQLSATIAKLRSSLAGQQGNWEFALELDAALKTTYDIARQLEGGTDVLAQTLNDLQSRLMAKVQAELTALAAAAAPLAVDLLRRAEAAQKSLQALADRLALVIIKLCPLIDGVSSPLDPAMTKYLAEDLVKRINAIGEAKSKLAQACVAVVDLPSALRFGEVAASLVTNVSAAMSYVGQAANGGNLDALVDLRALADDLLAAIGVPAKLVVSYDWRGDVGDFPPGSAAVFRPDTSRGSGPGNTPQIAIHTASEVSLRGGQPATSVTGKIDAFSLHLFGGAPFLILDFDPVTFTAGSGQSFKLDVRIVKVRFGQALKFVNDLAELLNADSGFYIQLLRGRPGVEVGYRFNMDIVQLAAMTLQNVSFSVAALLPFDNSPTRFKIAVGTKQNPILASVGIYGGGFFAALTMRADTIELLEAAFEYGVVTGCEFGGIAKGTCKITAGVYISLGTRDEITGYFSARGALTIASIFRVGGDLMVSLTRAGSEMIGAAVYTFEFSIGFAEYSYSVGVAYSKAGKDNMSESADGKKDPEPAASDARSARQTLTLARAGLLEADAPTAPGKPDHSLDFTDGKATGRLDPGLAEGSAWRSYWAAFADLEEDTDQLCGKVSS